jgi:glycosyltransferase involved in cell wall biosynthesis
MAALSSSPEINAQDVDAPMSAGRVPPVELEVGLLTGGFDRPYALGLAMALTATNVRLEVVGSDEVDTPEMHTTPKLKFLNLQGDPRQQLNLVRRAVRVMIFYVRLLRYAATAKPRIFHILWNSKLQLFDRTLLMLYYKLLGKRIVLTAHNVNAGQRDANDSLLNRLTLKVQYRLADRIFVHTKLMKSQLLEQFGVKAEAVTVIPFGINNTVPNTELTPTEAKQRLGIEPWEKTVLFFGSLRPYKGIEHLVAAFQKIADRDAHYRLVIAGEPRKECENYLHDIRERIAAHPSRAQVITKMQYIPDSETELYFKAADLLALPYVQVFQSGVLFLAYGFGLPVVAADISSFRDDVVHGQTGFLYDPADPSALGRTIREYFESDLYKELDMRRREIRSSAEKTHSWEVIGRTTRNVYEGLLAQ